ncbi:MAG: hypothetical protein V1912_09515 [bacterium]
MKPAGLSVFLRITVGRRPLSSERSSPRSRFAQRAIVAVAAVLAAVTVVEALTLVALPAPPARAATGQLTIEVDRILSLTSEAVTLTIRGTVSEQLTNAELVVRIGGPAEPSQVGRSDPQLPQVATLSEEWSPAGSGGVSGEATRGEAASETRAGPSIATIVIPADTPAEPGAYLLTAQVVSDGVTRASGTVWLGKAALRERPLDVAFVWPVALGVHRDSSGAFFDQALEDAVAPAGESPDGLRALLDRAGSFPRWPFTLAVEPILLAQLRDMADGYARLDASGGRQEVDTDDPVVKNAGQTLATFKKLAGMESVEIAVIPYAVPALGMLAAEGWRDGFQQIQLGKQELQQTLGLGSTPVGAYSPDLDMTTESLAYYGQASIDHVVVDGRLAEDLTEQVADGTVAVRVRDTENDRVTLVFADSGLRSLMAPPWDAGVFFAGLAAELASGVREALVIAPGADFMVPPSSYLEAIGEVLSRLYWVQTRTLTSLLRAHAPTTRPVLFSRSASGSLGYIEGSLLTSLRAAHAAVADLAEVADATRAPVERAHRLLYTAESRWWWLPQTSPEVASIGLAYADEARALAQGELSKARFAGASPTIFTGHRGTIRLLLDNGADYPFRVEVRLSGRGLTLPDGERLEVELQPGRTVVPVNVLNAQGAHHLDVLMVAGASTLDEWSHSVRFITVMTVLPWAVLAVVVIGGAAYLALRRRGRRRRVPVTSRTDLRS